MTVGYYIQPGDQIDIIADLGGPTSTSHAVTYAFQDVPGAGGGLHGERGDGIAGGHRLRHPLPRPPTSWSRCPATRRR